MQDLIGEIERIQKDIAAIDIGDMALQSVHDRDAEIIDTVTDDQLFAKGIDGTGKKIKPKYTPFTRAIKKQKGQPDNRVTLKDSGDFYNSVFMDKTPFPVQLSATDEKTPDLFRKYGGGILAMTKKNKTTLANGLVLADVNDQLDKRLNEIL